MSIEMIGVEVAKALITLALQEAQRAGLSKEQAEALYKSTKDQFYLNNPDNIPDNL